MGFFNRGPRPERFSDAISKTAFVEEWARSVLDEAGVGRDHPAAGHLAAMAADGIVRSCLRTVAQSYGEHRVVAYLEQFEPDELPHRLDEIYNTCVEVATSGRPGPVLRERISAFDDKLNQAFPDIRPNYVEIVRVNASNLTESLQAMGHGKNY